MFVENIKKVDGLHLGLFSGKYPIHSLKGSFTKTKRDSLNFFIQLKNMEYDYIITKIYLNSENSLFHHLTTMKFPPHTRK